MSKLQYLYGIGAIVGLIATWYFNIQFMAAVPGATMMDFLYACYANAASTSLTNDAAVAGTVFLLWSFVEARRLAIPRWWLVPLGTILIAFAFAFPLFLLVRENYIKDA